MSETIIGILVGAATAMLTSVITLLVSRGTAKAQMQQLVIKEYLNRRLDIYTEVFKAYNDLIEAPNPLEAKRAFAAITLEACLVASEETGKAIMKFRIAVIDENYDDTDNARMAALKAMQKDLNVFQIPAIKKAKKEP